MQGFGGNDGKLLEFECKSFSCE